VIGDRVRLRDAFLDDACRVPVVGTVEGVGVQHVPERQVVFVVMFEHDDPSRSPGGEFTADRLEVA